MVFLLTKLRSVVMNGIEICLIAISPPNVKVAVYPGNVLAIHMSKPHGFRYRSGQYMFVNCAAVSPFEWYVFEETSFTLRHIRHTDYLTFPIVFFPRV